jgi:NADH:ubiquinone oxidoreductase subunit 2 (subunit N)
MAGIPPLGGFFTKLFILSSLINHSFYVVVIIALLFTIISSYYYLNFIKYIYFEKKKLLSLFVYVYKTHRYPLLDLFFDLIILICFIITLSYFVSLAKLLSLDCIFKFSQFII